MCGFATYGKLLLSFSDATQSVPTYPCKQIPVTDSQNLNLCYDADMKVPHLKYKEP